jgi:hypothetical protein
MLENVIKGILEEVLQNEIRGISEKMPPKIFGTI